MNKKRYSIGDVRAAISKTWEGEQADLHQILVGVREYLESLPQASVPYVYHFHATHLDKAYTGTLNRSEKINGEDENEYHEIKQAIIDYFEIKAHPKDLCITSLSLVGYL
jgi:hypothetical protein